MIIWLSSYPKNGNTWLRSLVSAYYYTKDGFFLSDNQLNHLRKIVLDTPLPATDKQIWYIKKLGGDDFEIPDGLTKTAASDLITTLKGE